MLPAPDIIAHRGYTEDYPENTLPALDAAVRAGAAAVEFDVQFCRDGTPVLLHDDDLHRVSGQETAISQLDFEDLARFSAFEPGRLGDRHRGTPIPSLEQAVELLTDAQDVLAFVEIKRESLPMHSLPAAIQKVLKICRPLADRSVIISFEERVLQEARSLADVPVGWCLPSWDTAEWERAQTLKPEFLFCDQDFLPSSPAELWQGDWHWVIYEVNDVAAARALRQRGVSCIETRAVAELVRGLR